jgi:hypothetical protein
MTVPVTIPMRPRPTSRPPMMDRARMAPRLPGLGCRDGHCHRLMALRMPAPRSVERLHERREEDQVDDARVWLVR